MNEIPTPVRRFVEDHIDSIARLELLLLLESDPKRAWTAAAASTELRCQASWAASQLQYLAASGLAVRTNAGELRFRYEPASRDTRALVNDLRRAFKSRRVSLVSLIYTGVPGRHVAACDEPSGLSGES